MGYMHIDNLYKNTDIMLFKECYALEKIHGTSAHITFEEGRIKYMSGGSKHETFVKLFDEDNLLKVYKEQFDSKVIIYGEAYGGKTQGMSNTYGKEPKFIVFDVMIDGIWLDVPNAEDVTKKFGLEFVDYKKVKTTIKMLDKQKDLNSVQAVRNAMGNGHLREGVVLRPLIEVIKSNGRRVISKHKRDEFMETSTPREVDPNRLKVLEDANSIAKEWVTPMRLEHVLDKIDKPHTIEKTGVVVKAMVEDVIRESDKEIIVNIEVKKAIHKKSAQLYKNKISEI